MRARMMDYRFGCRQAMYRKAILCALMLWSEVPQLCVLGFVFCLIWTSMGKSAGELACQIEMTPEPAQYLIITHNVCAREIRLAKLSCV
jgi:hypothetical protein